MSGDALIASALVGAASGARSFTGVAAVARSASTGDAGPDRVLGRPTARRAITVLAAGELAADKLPIAPSRLEAPGLSGRLGGAAVSGLAMAYRADPRPSVALRLSCCVVAVGAASLAAVVGTRARGRAAKRFGQDWIGALAEDSVAITLGARAVRR